MNKTELELIRQLNELRLRCLVLEDQARPKPGTLTERDHEFLKRMNVRWD